MSNHQNNAPKSRKGYIEVNGRRVAEINDADLDDVTIVVGSHGIIRSAAAWHDIARRAGWFRRRKG
jgi:hypothetical protein